MQKKLLTVIILVAAMLLCAACGGEDNEPGNTLTETGQTTAGSGSEPEAAEYEKGIVADNVFTSAWLGMKWTAPENMIMMTDEELISLMEQSIEMVYEDNAQEYLDYAALTTVYELSATTVSGSPNIIMLTEKLPLVNMTEAQYIDILDEGLLVEGSGYSAGERESTVIAGLDFSVAPYTISMQGVEISQKYFVRKQEDRMIAIIITYSVEDDCEDLLACFESYEAE